MTQRTLSWKETEKLVTELNLVDQDRGNYFQLGPSQSKPIAHSRASCEIDCADGYIISTRSRDKAATTLKQSSSAKIRHTYYPTLKTSIHKRYLNPKKVTDYIGYAVNLGMSQRAPYAFQRLRAQCLNVNRPISFLARYANFLLSCFRRNWKRWAEELPNGVWKRKTPWKSPAGITARSRKWPSYGSI